MDRNRKLWIGTAGIAALVGAVALGAAGAVAGVDVLRSDDDRQAILDDAAAALGVDASELSDALENALQNRVDEAVEEGRLTEEQGDRLKERIDSGTWPFPLLGGLGHGLFGERGHGIGLGLGLGLENAAEYLDMSEAQLREKLADGKTLAEIARAEGKSVDGLVQALVGEARERIDAAVAAGRLSEERAERLMQGLEERIADRVNRELSPRGFGFRHGFGFGRHDFSRPFSRAPPQG